VHAQGFLVLQGDVAYQALPNGLTHGKLKRAVIVCLLSLLEQRGVELYQLQESLSLLLLRGLGK
jgi:hypothetical protein